MCILPVNIVNQKIFLCCWFLFIIIILLSGSMIIFNLFLVLLPPLRYFLLRYFSSLLRMRLRAVPKINFYDYKIVPFVV